MRADAPPVAIAEPDPSNEPASSQSPQVGESPGGTPPLDQSRLAWVRAVALLSGLLAVLLAVATPLLPVRQDRATLDWPQTQARNITAPLVSYTPLTLDLSVPCTAFATAAPGTTVLATVAPQAPRATEKGLLVTVVADAGTGPALSVLDRDIPVLRAPLAEIHDCAALTVHSTATATTAEFIGSHRANGTAYTSTTGGDVRPQVVGVFTELARASLGSAHLHAQLDTRFSSTPSIPKLAAMIAAVLFTLVALVALYRLDTTYGRSVRLRPRPWWRPTWRPAVADIAVLGTLLLWHIIGANTSDDGYILTMARTAHHAGYMANYYRWFGVAEAPFGWPYEVLATMTAGGTAGVWMRLPALLAGLACWLILSAAVLPRLGTRLRKSPAAKWTAGLIFLAAWLPYDNGLRPEPWIALGALLTWYLAERAIATGRLLPAAAAVLVAAFSLAAGPTGLICVAALIAGARPVWRHLMRRAASEGATVRTQILRYGALLAPGLAAGLLVLVVVFADQSLAAVAEATRVRRIVGPNAAWFDERTRWDSLLMLSPDGSLSRRFGILAMLLCLGVCAAVLLRRGGRIPGASRGPAARLLGIVGMALLLMMFTPTKWTHHFGVYAPLAGSLAGLTAVAMGTKGLRTSHGRWVGTASVFFLLAVTFTGSNGWWYVSSYGVPFYDKAPLIAGKGLSTAFLGLAILCLLVAGWYYLREPAPASADAHTGRHRRGVQLRPRGPAWLRSATSSGPDRYRRVQLRRPRGPAWLRSATSSGPDRCRRVQLRRPRGPAWLRSATSSGPDRYRRGAAQPLLVAAAVVVLFEVASLGKAALGQYPAYSVAAANLQALGGHPCALADDVLVETNTADSLLTPYSGSAADALAAENVGFTPNGVADDLTADADETVVGSANSVNSANAKNKTTRTTVADAAGGTLTQPGINGSAAALPFGLDPAHTPVLGSYTTGTKNQAHLTSQWYRLDPAARADPAHPVVVVTAAGRIKSVDRDGVITYGQDLRLEFTRRGDDGTVGAVTAMVPRDIGGGPSWRNLRVPVSEIPADANAVRIVAVANDLTPRQWLAVTPPRLPRLAPLQAVVGSAGPVLTDWHVGLAFNCQRPFDHRDGVAEMPGWRILPDRVGSDAANAWQDDIGGGPLGWTELLLRVTTVPGYLNHDWGRDWGQLERLTPYVTDAKPAHLDVTVGSRWGWATDAPIKVRG